MFRPSSFDMERFRRVMENRALRATRSGLHAHDVDDRAWSRPAGTVDDRPYDNYPVYRSIGSDDPVIGSGMGGVAGFMMNG